MSEMIAEEELQFQVTEDYTKEDIKRVQRTLLSIGKTAAEILEKNNIRHFIAYGTLLGAYRHKGFIPWDDDLDIFIVEEDYEKAMNCLEKELPQWIVMQSQKTDDKYSGCWTKLRDKYSQTEAWYYKGDNAFTYKGISVDLYVLYKAPYNKVPVELLKENIRYYKSKYKRSGQFAFSEYLKKELVLHSKLLIENIKRLFVRRKEEIFWTLDREYYEENWVFPLKKIRFEDYEFNAPNQGEMILNTFYGDYKKLPPFEKRRPNYSWVKFFREEFRELDENSGQLDSKMLSVVANALECDIKEIIEVEVLKKGMTNRSFRFCCRNKRYIIRIPGEGTGKMINRKQECQVYQTIEGKGICDKVLYMQQESGYKITEYLEGARVCRPKDRDDVRKCMEYLKKVHDYSIQVQHTFDIFRQIEQYESFWMGEPSTYSDYQQTKQKVYELKQYIDTHKERWTLTHIDAVYDNFLFVDDEIYLIDWEYAGMQDPYVDIAMFAIYAMYDREWVEWLIDTYFENHCPKQVRTRIYCYIAACGLLWSNWCEYKRICGVEFGEYSLRQYQYAKEYYKIAKERMEHE